MTRPTYGRRRADRDSTAFICDHCGRGVPGTAPGTRHRNHCPHCLWSSHVDMRPGDRLSGCRGLMEPISISVQPDGEWSLVHRCRECGILRCNRIAGDDAELVLVSRDDREMETKILAAQVLKEVAALPEAQSAAVLLVYGEGLKCR